MYLKCLMAVGETLVWPEVPGVLPVRIGLRNSEDGLRYQLKL